MFHQIDRILVLDLRIGFNREPVSLDSCCRGTPYISASCRRIPPQVNHPAITRKVAQEMSHHFDTKLAKKDPSMNICDMYLFPGTPGNTVMAMTVNADAGLGSSDALPDEALYAFRFDLDGDAHEDVVFKFRFGHPKHADGDEHRHIQSFQVKIAVGEQIGGDAGDLLVEGSTGSASSATGVSAFVGLAPEMWAADAIAFFNLLNALYKEDRYDAEVFLHRKNFFAKRNVIAMVLEVPNSMIGNGEVRAWATASLFGHAPEVQICRWGLPLITHLYLSDPATSELVDKFHASAPSHDVASLGPAVASFTARFSGRANPTSDAVAYGSKVAARLCPVMLPYEVGTPAAFDISRFNGRPLNIDAYDVMLSIGANTPIADGVFPDITRISGSFPYYGRPFSKEEQADLEPISTGFYE